MKILFKHLQKIILIIFCVSIFLFIAYLLFGGNSDNNMYAGFEIIIYGPFYIFFGSIIVYFFYAIKRLKWFLVCTAAIIIIGFIPFVIFKSGIDIYFRNLFNNSHLPEQYNEYQDIEKPVLEFKNKEMKILVGGSPKLNQYLSPQNNLIIGPADSIYENKITHIYYKFDSKGDFITKYSPPGADEILFEGYLINVDKEYYRLWALDGDTLKRKMKIYNKKLSLNTIKQNAFIADINEKAAFLFSEDSRKDIESKSFKKIIFLKDNKWNVFYCDTKSGETIKNKGIAMNLSDLFSLNSAIFYKWEATNSSENIQSQYFQKIKLERSDHETVNWNGCLYTNVIVDNDTLKIKEFLSFYDGETIESPLGKNYDDPRYLYYSNPNLEYQLFTKKSGELYMIKDKPKIQKKT